MASDSGGPGVLSASERDRQYCELCGKMENLLRCGRCRSSFYCCKEHQRQDWKKHKLVCQGGEAPRAQPAPAQPRVAPPPGGAPGAARGGEAPPARGQRGGLARTGPGGRGAGPERPRPSRARLRGSSA